MAFCIITDSASDVPESVIKEYNLHVMPTPVTIEGKDYFDGETIFPDEFYEVQASGRDIKTYHISQHMFHEHFLPFGRRNKAVTHELLEGQNVLRLQQVIQERQPLHRRRGIRYIADRQAVDAEVLCL